MKIYSSTAYVDPSKEKEWYQLQVINQWDWVSKSICYQYIGNTLISYKLLKYISISDTQIKCINITELTPEMEIEIFNMGYTLKRKKNETNH
jgi:hypothetical protein